MYIFIDDVTGFSPIYWFYRMAITVYTKILYWVGMCHEPTIVATHHTCLGPGLTIGRFQKIILLNSS